MPYTTDWRQTIRINNRKTFMVIALFFLVYFALGLLIDIYVYTGAYPDIPLSQILQAMINLELFPTITLVMLLIAGASLFITFTFHNRLMLLGTEYREITPENAQDLQEKQLYNVVEELKIAAGLQFMPKVFIINAEYMNAFASGFSEKSAMVAITRGLMSKLNRAELQAVMAHEVSHIRRMDIKLTLMASLLANLILIVLDFFIYSAVLGRDGNNNNRRGLETIILILRYLLPIVNVLLLLYLSRTREYMADAGCVELLRDNQSLASALIKINTDHEVNRDSYAAQYQKTPHESVRREAYIFDPHMAGISRGGSINDLFSTHPNLKDRLNALGFRYNEPR